MVTEEDRVIVRMAVGDLLKHWPRDASVMLMRFEVEMTLREIGEVIGLSRERARTLSDRGARRLRHLLRENATNLWRTRPRPIRRYRPGEIVRCVAVPLAVPRGEA